MKEKYILNDLSRRILHIGLAIVILAFFFAMLHIRDIVQNGAVIMSYVYSMMEHISVSFVIVVAAALLLDVHVKTEK